MMDAINKRLLLVSSLLASVLLGACASPLALDAPAPVATAPVSAAALRAQSQRFVCDDGSAFLARFGDVDVTLHTALADLTLNQALAADGARYAGANLEVWFKGQQASISRDGSHSVCTLQR